MHSNMGNDEGGHETKYSDKRSFLEQTADRHGAFTGDPLHMRTFKFDPNNNSNVEELDFPFILELESNGKTSPTKSFLKILNPMTNQYNLHPLVDLINEIRSSNLDEGFYDVLTVDKVFAVLLIGLSKIGKEFFLNKFH
jgi:hypothetical protein